MSKHNPLYIGIDGGGTSCRVRLCNENLAVIGQSQTGSANVFQSHQQAWQSVNEALELVRQQAGISSAELKSAHIVAGLAGAEISQCAQQFMHLAHDFTHFRLLSDAQIACLGAHEAQDGAIYIIGTGTIGLALKGSQWQQLGGWGFPLDDIGGGAWLGQQAIRSAIAQHDKQIAPSVLSESVWQFFKQDKDALIQWSQTASSGDYGRFAPLVLKAFAQGDAHAQNIVAQQMNALSQHLEYLSQLNIPLSLMGGLSEWVSQHLPSALHNKLTPAKADALTGALQYAKARSSQ